MGRLDGGDQASSIERVEGGTVRSKVLCSQIWAAGDGGRPGCAVLRWQGGFLKLSTQLEVGLWGAGALEPRIDMGVTGEMKPVWSLVSVVGARR